MITWVRAVFRKTVVCELGIWIHVCQKFVIEVNLLSYYRNSLAINRGIARILSGKGNLQTLFNVKSIGEQNLGEQNLGLS